MKTRFKSCVQQISDTEDSLPTHNYSFKRIEVVHLLMWISRNFSYKQEIEQTKLETWTCFTLLKLAKTVGFLLSMALWLSDIQ